MYQTKILAASWYFKKHLQSKKGYKMNNYSVKRAQAIKKSLGVKVAARYLKKRGVSLEMAVYILLGL
jgi:hypothetical protein